MSLLSMARTWITGGDIAMPSVSPILSEAQSGFDLNKGMPKQEIKSYLSNPISLLDAMGYKEKPSQLTYSVLKNMSVRNAVVSSIIATRTNQVSTFTKPARYSKDGIGYEIRLRDPKASPSKSQREIILALEKFLEQCGFKDDLERDDFDTLIRKIVRDTLTYDQVAIEVVPDRKGRPAEIIAIDGATIRKATEDYKGDDVPQGKEAKYVQVIDSQIQAWYAIDEMIFGIRNPRTDIYVEGYGFSELEQLIHQITAHLYAEEYNMRYFSQGGTTKGILNIKQDPGAANQEQLESFKRQWRAQVTGLTGAWKTPIVQMPGGIEYINVNQSNREMEYEMWMNYLINIACAVYQIDPAEINFPNNGGAGGSGSSLFESSGEVKIKNSKDKGLRPLLRFIESLINKFIIRRFTDELVFNFVGLDSKTEKEIADLDSQSVKTYKTINEVRKEHDYEPLPDGDVILDSSFMNMVSQEKQAKAMQQQSQPQNEQIPQEQGDEQVQETTNGETNNASSGMSDEEFMKQLEL